MSIVKPEYRRLFAQHRFLCDKVVLTQAWKKAHRYIRRSNWYADLLELDQSAVGIEGKLAEWGRDVEDRKASPSPMRMVPAPKTHRWGFDQRGWHEMETEEAGHGKRLFKPIWLRPLAHLGVREQTLATAVMLCLADCIETAQGDTDVADYFEARRRRIHSYGNRLLCRYDAGITGNPERPRPLAGFGWGNSETYRKYFVDYRRFLERPRVVAANVQDQLGRDEELFVVKLDLSGFFDLIHRPTLILRLEAEYRSFVADYVLSDGEADPQFWQALESIMDWKWERQDEDLRMLLKPLGENDAQMLPDGLPQGLVASGFLSNAYLLDFDRCLSGLLKRRLALDEMAMALPGLHNTSRWNSLTLVGSSLPDLPDLTIHDYCRYVDDIRLVVSVRGDKLKEGELRAEITRWVNFWLDAAASPDGDSHRLHINDGKTEVTRFRLMDGQVGVTSRMALIQSELSGPADMESLEQATTGLDALLILAERFDDCGTRLDGEPQHPLARVASHRSEVRDDTIKRYAAGRLVKVLRQRRSMTDLDAEIEPGLTSGDAIDHEMEMFARKLIRAWSHDPSLVLVLRYAMDLYPSPALLRIVIEALRDLIASRERRRARVGWYICADLMKAGAMETGMRTRDLEVASGSDLNGYRVLLLDLAKEVLGKGALGRKAPWYAQQQALLLLAVLDPCPVHVGLRTSDPQLSRYRDLLRLAAYPRQTSLDSSELVLSLVNQQLHPSPERFAGWMIPVLSGMNVKDRVDHLKMVAFTRPDLMALLLEKIDEQDLPWIDPGHRYLRIPQGMLHDTRSLEEFDNEKVVLWNLVTRPDNPFRQEILWLKLAHALIRAIQCPNQSGIAPKLLSLHAVTIKTKSWRRLGRPELDAGRLEIYLEAESVVDPRLETPAWCLADKHWFYALGRLLRCVVTGEQDFTVTPFLNRHDWNGYTGVRNSWYTRSLSMMHAPEQLGGEAALALGQRVADAAAAMARHGHD